MVDYDFSKRQLFIYQPYFYLLRKIKEVHGEITQIFCSNESI